MALDRRKALHPRVATPLASGFPGAADPAGHLVGVAASDVVSPVAVAVDVEAPATPAAGPPVAIAPATIVAPSMLEMRIRNLLGSVWGWDSLSMLLASAKRRRRGG
jgi:hypothetical protein